MTAVKKTPEIHIDSQIIKEHGLSGEEYQKILNILGRTPNLTELGIFSVMWSEHCSYKSTRIHLKKLPTTAPWVICGPGENAGVIDIGEGKAAIFKMESHNHPSYIEPYQGAATGVGGILRDIFTMGARPVANLNALRFGAINHPKTAHLLSGVVAGIGGYGNCMGIPTVGGECNFHPSYNGNILVNAMNVGIADKDKIFYSAASFVGAKVVYVGSKTGRDGIHGATMASAEFDDASEEKRPTVQVGDPFTEKLVMEACLELMATDVILSIQDMGAAGLTCSSLEMADKGGTGIELQLDKVPLREDNMTPYEIMLSESQERMLMVIKPGKEELAAQIFAKWEVDFAIIGKITDTGKMILKLANEEIASLPVKQLANDAPVYDRPYEICNDDIVVEAQKLKEPEDVNQILLTLLASPDIADKSWIWRQYDSQVMNDTVRASGADAAIVRIHGSNRGLAIVSDCTPRYCKANPVEGGKQAVAETYRNISAMGAKPLAITNCLNFGNPEKKEIMGQLVGCVEGMAKACKELNYPVISGNVSLYNETNGKAILPTPTIGGVGIVEDVSKVATNHFTTADQAILLIGETSGQLGSSVYLREIEKREEGKPPIVDLELEKNNADFVRKLITKRTINICHDISDGGLYVAIAKMSLAKMIGASIEVDPEDLPLFVFLFAEDQARYIITANIEQIPSILSIAFSEGVKIRVIGRTIAEQQLAVNGNAIGLQQLKQANSGVLEALF